MTDPWPAYLERNRRANVIYAWLPIATNHGHATPCHLCRVRMTQRADGICDKCKEKK